MSYIDITDRLQTILTGFTGTTGIRFGFSTIENERAVYGFETSKPDAYPAVCIVPQTTTREPLSTCFRLATFSYSIIIFFERTADNPRHRDIEETIQRLIDELITTLDRPDLLCDINCNNTQVISESWNYLPNPSGRTRTCTLTLTTTKKFSIK